MEKSKKKEVLIRIIEELDEKSIEFLIEIAELLREEALSPEEKVLLEASTEEGSIWKLARWKMEEELKK